MFQDIGEKYEFERGSILGHGAFAIVFKGRDKKTGDLVAVKQINMKNTGGKLSVGKKEIDILKKLKHVNIVQLHEVVEQKSIILLVMEYCNGGDLGDYLHARKTLSEESIRHFARNIVNGLQALRKLDIIHRDLKPQNLLLSYNVKIKSPSVYDITLKIADFGFARHLSGDDMAATLCGSPLYMAPEVLLGNKYDSLADLWSVGTILFQCLSGEPPFTASNPNALRKKYQKEDLKPKIPEYASQALCHLLIRLLKKNPKERISFNAFFDHPFLAGAVNMPEQQDSIEFHSARPVTSEAIPISSHRTHNVRRRSNASGVSISPRSYGMTPGSVESSYSSSIEPPSFGVAVNIVTDSPDSVLQVEEGEDYVLVHNSRRPSISPRQDSCSSRASSYATPRSHGSSLSSSPITTPFYPSSPHNSDLLATPPAPPPSRQLPFGSLFPKVKQDTLVSPTVAHKPQNPSTKQPHITPSQNPFGQSPLIVRRSLSNNSSSGNSNGSSPRVKRHGSVNKRPSGQAQIMRNHSEGSQLCDLPQGGLHYQPSSLPAISPLGLPKLRVGGLNDLLQSEADQEGILEGERVRSRTDVMRRQSADSSGSIPRNISNTSLGSADSVREEGRSKSGSISSGSEAFFSIAPEHFMDSGQESDQSLKSIEDTSLVSEGHIPFGSLNLTHSPAASPNSALTFPFSPHLSGDSLLTPVAHKHHPLAPWSNTSSERLLEKTSSHSMTDNVAMTESTATIQGDDPQTEVPECVSIMQCALVVAQENFNVAQGLLRESCFDLSNNVFSLSCSSSMEDPVRYQEQLVLLAKAVHVLKMGLRAVELEDASLVDGLEVAPDVIAVQSKVQVLLQKCTEEAAAIKEKVLETKRNTRQQCVTPAEKMMYLRAMKLCQDAALEEKFGNKPPECIKRYHIAKCLVQQLLSEAQSRHDKHALQKYLLFLDHRIHAVSKVSSV